MLTDKASVPAKLFEPTARLRNQVIYLSIYGDQRIALPCINQRTLASKGIRCRNAATFRKSAMTRVRHRRQLRLVLPYWLRLTR